MSVKPLPEKVERTLTKQGSDHSPELLSAQNRLRALRQKRKAERTALGLPVVTDESGRSILPYRDDVDTRNSADTAASRLLSNNKLPQHLGWESTSLTAVTRTAQKRHQQAPHRENVQNQSWVASLEFDKKPQRATVHTGVKPCATVHTGAKPRATVHAETKPPSPSPTKDSLKLYPDIALAMLRQQQATAGRIWLLLRYLDKTGCGWVTVKEARKQITGKESALRTCGWRQLRNLFKKGEGVFWQRSDGRIWLRSVAKVAVALDLRRLRARPVALPVAVLTQGMGAVRAHFYASFHSSRTRERERGRGSRPITRETLANLSCVSPRTQRLYDKKANVQKSSNYAVGAKSTPAREEEQAWQHGHALFRLTDHKGKQGKPGVTYLAWQLPNTYLGPHVLEPRGRQKRINKELTDLFMKGMTGNGQERIEDGTSRHPKCFYGSGHTAAKAYNRSHGQDVYWRSRLQTRHGRFQFWYQLPRRR